MAEYSTPEDRTEMPTDKRMQQLRDEGAVPMSAEVVMVASLLSGFIGLQVTWDWLLKNFKIVLTGAFNLIRNTEPLTTNAVMKNFYAVLFLMVPPVLIMLLIVSIVAILTVMLQTKWNLKKKWIDLKISHLNPMGGIGRIFSIQGVVNTLKSFLKLVLILPIAYIALRQQAPLPRPQLGALRQWVPRRPESPPLPLPLRERPLQRRAVRVLLHPLPCRATLGWPHPG